MPNLRGDQFLLHAGINGVNIPSTFSWTSMEGGDLEAQNVKTHPGGMLPEQDLGGPTSRTDATMNRNYNAALHAYFVQLENASGRGSMWMSWTPLDANGNPNGGTVTITGKVKGVKAPGRDANNTGPAYLSVMMSCDVESTISQ